MAGDGFLRDCDGELSSKRVVACVAFAAFLAFGAVDVVFTHKVSDTILTNLMFIVGAGLGFAATERFAPPKGPQP